MFHLSGKSPRPDMDVAPDPRTLTSNILLTESV